MDDDNYVNPSLLVNALSEYNWEEPFYVGRPSREGVQYVSVSLGKLKGNKQHIVSELRLPHKLL